MPAPMKCSEELGVRATRMAVEVRRGRRPRPVQPVLQALDDTPGEGSPGASATSATRLTTGVTRVSRSGSPIMTVWASCGHLFKRLATRLGETRTGGPRN